MDTNVLNSLNSIQDPIARAEARRAQAVAQMILDGSEGLRSLVKSVVAKISAHIQYRRTVDVLTAMTDRELDDIGISRGDIPAVARGEDPRQQTVARPGDALAQRLALAEAFEQGTEETKVVAIRTNDNRPAAAA